MDNKIKNRISLDGDIQGSSEEVKLADAFDILSQYDNYGIEISSLPVREEGKDEAFTPLTIRGVENKKIIEIGIDYLQLTIYADDMRVFDIYSNIFMDKLGDLAEEGQTKFYEHRYKGANGFALMTNPKNKGCRYHAIMTIPGQACKLISILDLEELLTYREKGILINCTRIDLRADGCPFTPRQIYRAVENGKAQTRTTRASIRWFEQPNDIRDDGQIGSQGIELGSRTSERFLRVYNKHGFTRFELECKGETANIYFYNLMRKTAYFNSMTMGIFQDYIRIDEDFWKEFIKDYDRAYMAIDKYEDKTLEKIERYLYKQAASCIGIMYEIKGEKWLKNLAEKGIKQAKNNPKYYQIMHAYGIDL